MATITAAMVKDLRETTGVGMMDCKQALTANDGDMQASIDWLRKKGLSKAAKKSDRVAAEGLIGVVTSGTKGVVVEVNSETDFVARNEQFQGLVKMIAQVAHKLGGHVDAIQAHKDGAVTVETATTTPTAPIAENIGRPRAPLPEPTAPAVPLCARCGRRAGTAAPPRRGAPRLAGRLRRRRRSRSSCAA